MRIMKKKLGLFICLSLLLSAFIPVLTIAIAKNPDDTLRLIEKKVIIHYKRGYGRPPGVGGGKPPKDDGQYELLGKGVEWKSFPVEYVINPFNPDGLPEQFVVETIIVSANEWDDHTGENLFADYTYGTAEIDYSAVWGNQDFTNVLAFGDYAREGVIAVTIIWGYFSGPPSMREIVEFDILFDTDYNWGDATIDDALMDLQNIATHEIGHGAGLDDLYDTSASEETMYGYSDYGELKKRDLYTGDIAGIQTLYGK